VEIKGVGSVVFTAKTGEHRLLTGVYYIPALRNSMISLGQLQLDENGSRVEIEHGVLRIWDRHRRLLAKVNRGANRLYILHVQVAQPVCLAARRDDDAWRWHERFGHLNFEALRQLGNKEMVQGMSRVEHVEQRRLTKQRRLPFPRQAAAAPLSSPGELLRQGEVGARARRPLRPRDTRYTWRPALHPATR
jgi:hypothetical protein